MKLPSELPSVLSLGLHPDIIQSVIDYDYLVGKSAPSISAIIAAGKKQERFFWGESEIVFPVLADLHQLDAHRKKTINTILNLQSGRRALATMTEAIHTLPNLKLATIFAEQVPEAHALIINLTAAHNILVAGPSSVGMLIPGMIKLGAIGGISPEQIEQANIIERGDVAVISTSGGMVNELIHTITRTGNRISFAIALGGDRFPVLSPAEAMLLAEQDKATKAVVYFGELGGRDEYDIARLMREKKFTKPLYAYIAGSVAALFKEPPQFGHAKAMAQVGDETAAAKRAVLLSAGAVVTETFGDIEKILHARESDDVSVPHVRSIGMRTKKPIMSRISGDVHGDIQLLGNDLLSVVQKHSFASLVLSMWLGQEIKSKKLADFTDFTLRLLIDHGPYVSGALNTVITARAGKDLISSLTAGLLTIGPRFGGAVNDAAQYWLEGVTTGTSAKEFVMAHTEQGGIIPGIGHKKYRIDAMDPRVAALRTYSGNKNGDRYLQFALSVQTVTAAKKGNLILNVDGCIAAIMLDLLESELKLDTAALEELINTEFFNALFVLSRSVGFMAHYMDQRRNDEGLLRADDTLITYIPDQG